MDSMDLVGAIFLKATAKCMSRLRACKKDVGDRVSEMKFLIDFMDEQKKRPPSILLPNWTSVNEGRHKCSFKTWSIQRRGDPETVSEFECLGRAWCIARNRRRRGGGVYENGSYCTGLICFECEDSIIVNPTSGKSMILPKIPFNFSTVKTVTYLGYDPSSSSSSSLIKAYPSFSASLIKALKLTTGLKWKDKEPHMEQHIISLGENLWRPLNCEFHHEAVKEKAVCIKGKVFYGAYAKKEKEACLVKFDMKTEQFCFDTVPVPNPSWPWHAWTLSEFKGRPSMAFTREDPSKKNDFTLWVLENGNWFDEVHVDTRRFKEGLAEEGWLTPTTVLFEGSTAGGDVREAVKPRKFVVYLDHDKDSFQRFLFTR